MVKVVGVRFRNAGKIYYFGPGKLDIHAGMHVIVETARGVEMGTVMMEPKGVSEEEVIQPLKPVIRIATEADEKTVAKNREKEKDAFRICLEKIAKHKLDMKLVEAEYTFDNNKLLFYFTADGRIDFRELVKDLAAVFRTRIELRQIGVRDETKIMGGIGICGRALCCNTYLSEFAPVSIKMAKEQNLSLNPTKISGVCGRLMCCLKNEEETYEYLNSRLPGAVIIKFWVQIDKDTQLERFNERQNTPEKQWKITEEDWRNREKWDQYETAVNEMITKTSTTYAPWHILESVDKKYARIKALRIVIEELEKALD